jgi:hypothetical protein
LANAFPLAPSSLSRTVSNVSVLKVV